MPPLPHLAATLALMSIGLACASAHARAQPPADLPQFLSECRTRLAPAKIEVEVAPTSWTQSDTASVKELTAQSATAKGKGFSTLGSATANFSMSIQWGSNWLVHRQGSYACVIPHIKVGLTVGPQLVQIAREFAGNPCVRRQILEHELRHVHANQRQLEETANMLRTELQAVMGSDVFHGDYATLRSQLQHSLSNEWTALAKKDFERVSRIHGQIDSPAEYARNNVICDGAVPKILSGFAKPAGRR